ncbi:MAG: Gldg family protein, partial [Planctomycetes bacterium]|nr:Gldg family protein [Planctomycetota bacterium]
FRRVEREEGDLRVLREPLMVRFWVSEQMPAANPKLGETIEQALRTLVEESGGNFKFEREVVSWGRVLVDRGEALPFVNRTQEDTVDPRDPTRKGARHYYSVLQIVHAGRMNFVWDFSGETTTDAVLTKMEPFVHELTRPRTKLGMVLPPAPPNRRSQPGQVPQTDYTPLFNFVQQNLGYETEWVDLLGQRRIPRDLSCLVVFEPNRLSERELYEIDRYLAEGGHVVMFCQGWEAKLRTVGRVPSANLALTKTPMHRHFEDWARNLGIEFDQTLLIDRGGKLAPYREHSRTGAIELIPASVPLAAVVEPGDINGQSVYGRGLGGLPLPFVVRIKPDDAKIAAAGLERQDIIALKNDIYRFIPANPAFPELPLNMNLNSPAEVESDPDATPGEKIRLHRLGEPALVATALRGQFTSFWTGDRKVPAWETQPGLAPPEDPLAGQPAPELKPRPGSLILYSSAGSMNIEYLYGYNLDEVRNALIPIGL